MGQQSLSLDYREMASEEGLYSSTSTHRTQVKISLRSRSPPHSFTPALTSDETTSAIKSTASKTSGFTFPTTSQQVLQQKNLKTSLRKTTFSPSTNFSEMDSSPRPKRHEEITRKSPKQPSPQSSVDSAFTSTSGRTSGRSSSRIRSSSGAVSHQLSSPHTRHKASSFSSRRSSSSSSSSGSSTFEVIDPRPEDDNDRNETSSPNAIRQCNRYGWFIDSEEAQDE